MYADDANCALNTIVVIASRDQQGSLIAGFRIVPKSGLFEIKSNSQPLFLTILHLQYPFDQLHIVAQSMGGLVATWPRSRPRGCEDIMKITSAWSLPEK